MEKAQIKARLSIIENDLSNLRREVDNLPPAIDEATAEKNSELAANLSDAILGLNEEKAELELELLELAKHEENLELVQGVLDVKEEFELKPFPGYMKH